MFSSLDGSMFILPLCYHPTTLLSVDDDVAFLKFLSLKFDNKLPILCFSTPQKALEYIKEEHKLLPFSERCIINENNEPRVNIMVIRQEPYNPLRFKEIYVFSTDYDMPGISGLELIKEMAFTNEISQNSHIIVTGKDSVEFKDKLSKMGKKEDYIRKDDPDYLNKLIELFKNRTEKIFQWYSYMPARLLSNNCEEKTSFLFDGNFSDIFNSYIKENNICEFYLFDSQGSYLFLDRNANLSWFFIRNEKGMQNSIKLAKQYGAPAKIIEGLESRKYILSLYETEDFERIKVIDWDKYLLAATKFESDDKYLSFFPNLLSDTMSPNYYYAFTKDFPDHGIRQEEILSYNEFLQDQE